MRTEPPIKEGEWVELKKDEARLEAFIKKNKFIYRYLPQQRMLDILQKAHLVFINPKKWDDPFDNFLFRQLEKEEIEKSFLKGIYAMCFTLSPHSQAYWKNYAPHGYAARIKFRTKEFMEIFNKVDCKVWLGRMTYMREKELIEKLRNTKGLKASLLEKAPNAVFLETFLYKRLPFQYEDEIRILISSDKTEEGIKQIKIDIKKIIEDIWLDPNMTKEEEIAFKEYLSKFGIPIKKSQLFTDKEMPLK